MRAYQAFSPCPLSLSNTHANTISTHGLVYACYLDTHTLRENRTILHAMFVPVAGNWRVFIRLMDMKSEEDGGWSRKSGRGSGIVNGRVGGNIILAQQISYNGPNKSYGSM